LSRYKRRRPLPALVLFLVLAVVAVFVWAKVLNTANDMTCRGQIRFGAPGARAARTLSLIEPCLELVRDERQDATVDIAIGKKFDEVKPNHDARKVLDQLAAWAAQQPDTSGGQAAEPGPPTLVPSNVAAARAVHC
jgi:hypothetical protein